MAEISQSGACLANQRCGGNKYTDKRKDQTLELYGKAMIKGKVVNKKT